MCGSDCFSAARSSSSAVASTSTQTVASGISRRLRRQLAADGLRAPRRTASCAPRDAQPGAGIASAAPVPAAAGAGRSAAGTLDHRSGLDAPPPRRGAGSGRWPRSPGVRQVNAVLAGQPAHQRRDERPPASRARRVRSGSRSPAALLGRRDDRPGGRPRPLPAVPGPRVRRATRVPCSRRAVADQHVAGPGLLLLAIAGRRAARERLPPRARGMAGPARPAARSAAAGEPRVGRSAGATEISGWPTSSVWPGSPCSTATRPAYGQGTSTMDLAVSTSTIGLVHARSSSPTATSQLDDLGLGQALAEVGQQEYLVGRSWLRVLPLEVVDGVEDPVHAGQVDSARASAPGRGCRSR